LQVYCIPALVACAAVRSLAPLVLMSAGCASIPLPQGAPAPDVEAGVEVNACVLWGERHERRMFEGVAELSPSPWHQAIATVVLTHPKRGLIAIDPAFGSDIADDLSRVPPWFRIISGTAKGKTPTVVSMEAAGIEPRSVREVLLTHPHWDHTGALGDLPRATVRLARPDYDYVAPMTAALDHGVLPHLLRRAWKRLEPFDTSGPPLLRFEASNDLFQDGSVIAVPLPGHTPGSTGYLVRGRGGKRWLFTGDSTWTLRGVEKPAHKTVPIDADKTTTGETIGRLHALLSEHPEIAIFPAHDAAALEALPTCTQP
jgi:glyoxylase-like metal-dependent hydrolase (beta-lactamase superfamily II)